MAWQRPFVVAAVATLALAAGCAQGPAADPEAACAARGLSPGTADFAACLHPSEAAALQRAEEGWQQMQDAPE